MPILALLLALAPPSAAVRDTVPVTLPPAAVRTLDALFGTWTFAETPEDATVVIRWFDPGAWAHLFRGDFDGDGATDYAAFVEYAARDYDARGQSVVALLARGDTYEPHLISTGCPIGPEERIHPLYAISRVPAGFELACDDCDHLEGWSGQRARVDHDAIDAGLFEKPSDGVFAYRDGRFVYVPAFTPSSTD